ncbi:AAA family ATPase [Streptomyces sp. NPDC020747]|uniref:AAA family ATPase n=1 Tax=Streptomyces sp. NPDC020747 TaxID=3365086 RepID=UPI0037BD1E7B
MDPVSPSDGQHRRERPQPGSAVLIIGPPAAGKSTLAKALVSLTGPAADLLLLDTVHRQQCPPPGGPGYHYEGEQLVLDDRPRLMRLALKGFNDLIHRYQDGTETAVPIVEFASADYAQALAQLPALRAMRVCTLEITAPLDVLRIRNAARAVVDQVPDVFLSASQAADTGAAVALADGRYRLVDTSVPPQGSTLDMVCRQLRDWQLYLTADGLPTS